MPKKDFSADINQHPMSRILSGDAETAAKKKAPPAQPEKKLVKKSYYITPEQDKAIKLKIALGGKDKDYSSVVRAALDRYLSDILRDLK